jgi:hypothetical protein
LQSPPCVPPFERNSAPLLVLSCLLASACGSPGPQVEAFDVAFAQRSRRIVTVDVMPIAVAIGVDADHPLDATQATAVCRAEVVRRLREELPARGYRIAGFLDPHGRYSRGRVRQAMSESDLALSQDEVARFAAAQRDAPGAPPQPVLPPLGRETGSDATLFVSGSGHAPTPLVVEPSDLFLVLPVFGPVGTVAATAAILLHRDDEPTAGRPLVDAASVATDGRETVVIFGEEEEQYETVRRPHDRLRLTMTLDDNRTGAVLWHSDRGFRVSPIEPLMIRRSLELTAHRLPCGGASPAARGRAAGLRDLLGRRCPGQRAVDP